MTCPDFFVGSICDSGPDYVPKCPGPRRKCIVSPLNQIFTCLCGVGYMGSSEGCAGTTMSLKSKYTLCIVAIEVLHGRNNRFFFLWEKNFFLMKNIFIVPAMAAVENLYSARVIVI